MIKYITFLSICLGASYAYADTAIDCLSNAFIGSINNNNDAEYYCNKICTNGEKVLCPGQGSDNCWTGGYWTPSIPNFGACECTLPPENGICPSRGAVTNKGPYTRKIIG